MFETKHYKSWSGLNKQLTDAVCKELRGRITYFLTRYHDVHNAYGRAAIRLDGKELIQFSWVDMYRQEADVAEKWRETGKWNCEDPELLKKWNDQATFSDYDFLFAATKYLQLSIQEALESDNSLLRVFAIMDKRVGKRTLERLRLEGTYRQYPEWVQQFYRLRWEASLSEVGNKKGDPPSAQGGGGAGFPSMPKPRSRAVVPVGSFPHCSCEKQLNEKTVCLSRYATHRL